VQNFGSSIAEAQIDTGSNSEREQEALFSKVDLILTLAFTVELVLNAFANWLRPFITNGWSIFDFLIVTLSLISLAVDGVPVRLILLLRCCRVLRIFGKVPSVAKIFAALFQSLIPMMNAFFIIFIIAAICEPSCRPSSLSI
jgi:voltage-gated sodium channel